MRFLVRVSCYESYWLMHAPAFGVARFVTDKKEIRAKAHEMIARCGAAPSRFEIDLELGRVLDTAGAQQLAKSVRPPLGYRCVDPTK